MTHFARFASRVLALLAVLVPAAASAQYSVTKIGSYLSYAYQAANGGIFSGYNSIGYSNPVVYLPSQSNWAGLPDATGFNTSYQYWGKTTGISHDGTVIAGYTDGEVSNGVYVQYAVYWENGQEFLVPAPPDDPTANNMTATAVSGDGSTLLIEDTTSSHVESYVYKIASGAFTPLGYFGATTRQTYATCLSNNGAIVAGYSYLDNNNIDGFIWTASTGMKDIGLPPGYTSSDTFYYVEPVCMSDDGSVLYSRYTVGNGWQGSRYTSTQNIDLAGLAPSACTSDGSEVVGTLDLYFPGIWTAKLGGGFVDHLLSANGIASTIGDYTGPFTLAPNGTYMSALTPFGYNGEGAPEYGTAQIDLPFPLATVPIADGGYYTASYGATLSVAAPGVTGPACSEFGGGSTAVLVSSPSYATKFSLSANGSFSYTPKSGMGGELDSFSYTLKNSSGESGVGTVQIQVGPYLSSVSPSSVTAGSGNTTVTLTGQGFTIYDAMYLNTNTALSTTYVSGTELQAVIPAANLANAGTLSLADNGFYGLSNTVTVTVTSQSQSGPTVTKIVTPSTIHSKSNYTCQVVLSGPAPTGGATVSLSSSNSAVARVPSIVKVLAGQLSANFTLSTGVVTKNTNVTLTAKLGKSSAQATITIQP
jgi:hypothetical protein